MHLKVKKGLDIPILGKPEGDPQDLPLSSQVALHCEAFPSTKFRVLVAPGDRVQIGQKILEDKESPGRFFVAPAAGVVKELRRGLKRRLLAVVIERDEQEKQELFPKISLEASRGEILSFLEATGGMASIRQRPFNRLADVKKTPRSIFVKALESAPFVPPAEMQVKGREEEFWMGLSLLQKLTDGHVHLVYRKGVVCRAFTEANGVEHHTVEGPHPSANVSLHIQHIDPITTPADVVWTLSALSVVQIGASVMHRSLYRDRVVALAGTGISAEQRRFWYTQGGVSLSVFGGMQEPGVPVRWISGDPLTGQSVTGEDFLGFYDTSVIALPRREEESREFLHFFRVKREAYSFSRTYFWDFFQRKNFFFSTNPHGELRPFIDNTLYDRVMPLSISTMHLVKALLAEDDEQAIELGLLEVDAEDFALPAFVCPSKIEMVEILKQGLMRCSEREK